MSKPAHTKILSTPGIPESHARLTLSASTSASAGAALCFRKLLDTSVWHDWNHLVPEVTIRSQPSEDEWETPFTSRNPSIAPCTPSSPQTQPSPRFGSIGDVALGRDSSQEAPPYPPPASSSDLDLLPSSRVGSANHLTVQDPLEGGQSCSTSPKNSGRLSPTGRQARQLIIATVGGELSVRLRLGTSMTFLVVLNSSKIDKYRKTELVVSELVRPGDQPPGQPSVYRIMWESDTSLKFPHSFPKWLLFAQRVTEIRPVVRGDGKEGCEITTWECQRGFLARFVKRYYKKYLQRMFEQNVEGLRDYCEAMGGAVDRRDFSTSAGL
jgi:hypothetical protein